METVIVVTTFGAFTWKRSHKFSMKSSGNISIITNAKKGEFITPKPTSKKPRENLNYYQSKPYSSQYKLNITKDLNCVKLNFKNMYSYAATRTLLKNA